MKDQTLQVSPGPTGRSVRTTSGQVLQVPDGWQLLPPGDAGLTRRVKAAGPTWTVKVKKGRRTFSQGVWADARTISNAQQAIVAQRESPAYQKRRQSELARREKKQTQYVDEFRQEVIKFLRFDARYQELAESMGTLVAVHATPVGSGTVARTERIPIERRAEAAVIAWMRHQTTAYDSLKIARVKGERRQVRRQLAEHSRKLLHRYRKGEPIDPQQCVLAIAVASALRKQRTDA
ncbi:MAG: hypothetical protein CBB71_03845 [Rhodopirellula sp. TMED11]|nr:MAG: hypothetical protein CBB71_03845 [Rhodopirellula sp. TMED11]